MIFQDPDECVFDHHRDPHAAQELQVPLRDVGIGVLAGVVVVEHVVFVIPRLGQKPVEPVDVPPPAACEDLARVPAGNIGNAVVAAMQDVMREQPAGELSEAQQEGAERIGDDPGRGVARERGDAAIALDPSQVGQVGRPDVRMGLGLQPVDGVAESGDIDVAEVLGHCRFLAVCHAERPW
jgi:hypothetical protein